MIVSIRGDVRETLLPALFMGGEIDSNFRKILGRSVKHGGLGIPDPRSLAKSAYNTSKASSGGMLGSLLGIISLTYVGHRAYIWGGSMGAIK